MSKRKYWLTVSLSALLATGAIGGYLLAQRGYLPLTQSAQASAAVEPQGTAVDVATVVSRPITEWQSYSGRLEAVDQVEIRPQVSGTIVETYVKDGGVVQAGDALFKIDPRPYAAEVNRATAELAAAQARANYAATDVVRAEKLFASKTISSREHDAARNAAGETAARVQAAKAALDAAKIALGHTDIVAPVSGRVSRSELTVGNVVSAGVSAPLLATLVSVSPIYASFEVDEQAYLRFFRRDAGRAVPVVMGLADEDGYPRTGTVVSIDNHLDVSSGTILVRAKFNNADGSLVPGLYARLRISGGNSHPAVLVDDSAIGTDQAKKYVLVVEPTNRVRYREVKVGDLQDGYRVIAAGLEPGERIVVRGVQRVRPNDLVQPNLVQMAAATGQAAD